MDYSEYTVELTYLVIFTSLMIMASSHNLIRSVLLYCVNNFKVSSLLKIILNLIGLACGLSNAGLILTLNSFNLSDCSMIIYSQTVLNFAFSESVIIFLVWKLRQFRKSILDHFLLNFLHSIRSLFYLLFISYVQPQISIDIIAPDATLCDNDVRHGKYLLLTTTMADLLIDAYVTFHIIQCILGTNQSERQQQLQRPHSIYILIVLNLSPIFMASLYHLSTLMFKMSVDFPDDYIRVSNLENGDYVTLNDHNELSIPNDDIVLRAPNGMLVEIMEQQYKIVKVNPDIK